MTARDLLRIVREGWILILASTIVFAGLGFAYAATRTPIYQATSSLIVSACVPVGTGLTCDPVGGLTLAAERARVIASTSKGADVVAATTASTQVTSSDAETSSAVNVVHTDGSSWIDVVATWPTSTGAAEIANTYAQVLRDTAEESASDDPAGLQIEVVSEAIAPSASSANQLRTVALAVMLGLFVGFGLALLVWLLNTRLRDRPDIEDNSGAEVLGELRLGLRGKRVRELATPAGAPGDFQSLQAVVASRLARHNASTIAVIAPVRDDSASVVAFGLAETLAASETNVAVLRLHASDSTPTALKGEATFREVDLSADSSEAANFFSSPRFAKVLEDCRINSEMVILDVAAMSTGAEALAATRHADVALVVVVAGETLRGDLKKTLHAIGLVGVPVLGIAAIVPTERAHS